MIRFHDRFRSARFWGACVLLWFILLNLLSHGNRFHPPWNFFNLDIPHFDKVVHFGYFFGGGGLLAATLFFKKARPPWLNVILIVTVSLSIIGVLDEWHQSFFANRTGNDPGDWLADTLGALCGTLVFRKVHRVLL